MSSGPNGVRYWRHESGPVAVIISLLSHPAWFPPSCEAGYGEADVKDLLRCNCSLFCDLCVLLWLSNAAHDEVPFKEFRRATTTAGLGEKNSRKRTQRVQKTSGAARPHFFRVLCDLLWLLIAAHAVLFGKFRKALTTAALGEKNSRKRTQRAQRPLALQRLFFAFLVIFRGY